MATSTTQCCCCQRVDMTCLSLSPDSSSSSSSNQYKGGQCAHYFDHSAAHLHNVICFESALQQNACHTEYIGAYSKLACASISTLVECYALSKAAHSRTAAANEAIVGLQCVPCGRVGWGCSSLISSLLCEQGGSEHEQLTHESAQPAHQVFFFHHATGTSVETVKLVQYGSSTYSSSSAVLVQVTPSGLLSLYCTQGVRLLMWAHNTATGSTLLLAVPAATAGTVPA
eukprot:9623-Heterococcus_DN1.PRE.1